MTKAVTSAAFGVSGIDRVEIHHDKSNVASASIPRSLGFVQGAEVPDEVRAPAEIGIDCTWFVACSDWTTDQ